MGRRRADSIFSDIFVSLWGLILILKILYQCSNCSPWYSPKGVENTSHKHLGTGVQSGFTHNWQKLEQPRCPSGGGWVKKRWHLQTVEYYSAGKRNALPSQEKPRKNHIRGVKGEERICRGCTARFRPWDLLEGAALLKDAPSEAASQTHC